MDDEFEYGSGNRSTVRAVDFISRDLTCGERAVMPSDRTIPGPSISQKLDMQRDRVMDIPNVIGVGLGAKGGHQQVVVLVTQLTASTEQKLKNIFADIPYEIEETSPFEFH